MRPTPEVPDPLLLPPLESLRFFEAANVMDGEGNLFSLTESDGHTSTPMIPGWGFGLGGRMYQFNLDPELANVMAPGKRPRNTNSPLLVMKDGQPFMGLSTPGGDQQLQSLLQVFLNVVVWGMSPEQALDQPRFGSYNFPGSGSEVNRNPAVLFMEDRIPAETAEALRHGPRRALSGDIYLVKPSFACPEEQAKSSRPDWLRFDGVMVMVFSSEPKLTRHTIRPVG